MLQVLLKAGCRGGLRTFSSGKGFCNPVFRVLMKIRGKSLKPLLTLSFLTDEEMREIWGVPWGQRAILC